MFASAGSVPVTEPADEDEPAEESEERVVDGEEDETDEEEEQEKESFARRYSRLNQDPDGERVLSDGPTISSDVPDNQTAAAYDDWCV